MELSTLKDLYIHLEETREHAVRLEKILKSHDQTTRGPKCRGMEGLVAEGAEMIEEEAATDEKPTALATSTINLAANK